MHPDDVGGGRTAPEVRVIVFSESWIEAFAVEIQDVDRVTGLEDRSVESGHDGRRVGTVDRVREDCQQMHVTRFGRRRWVMEPTA